jgi:hypothetical protein
MDKEKCLPDKNYILDLSRVFYIDSYGISFIQNIILGTEDRKNVIIVSDKDYINYVIRFNKIDKLLKVKFVPTLEGAIEKFGEGSE